MEKIFPGLVDSLIDSRMAAEDARRQNLHDTAQFKDQIARIEEQVLQRMALSMVIADKVGDAEVKARYEAKAKKLADVELIKVRHRSEEHTSELQSQAYLVCRLLLEKKKQALNKENM